MNLPATPVTKTVPENIGQKSKKLRPYVPKKRLIISAAALLAALGGLILARCSAGFADFYGYNIYPVIEAVFGSISGIFPFSAGELLVTAAVLLVIAGIVYFIVGMIKKRGRRLSFLASSAATVLMCLSLLLFDFTYCSGINYYRKPFSEIAGFKTGKYSREQVCEVLEYTIAQMNILCDKVDMSADGHVILPASVNGDCRAAMKRLSEKYKALDRVYPPVKPVVLSKLMSYGHIVGIYSFYTLEANYSTDNVPENIGHTMCHELSHLTGFMREDEANFISYLACRDSGSDYLMYSGYYSIMIHLLNAYYPEVSGEEYGRVLSTLDPRVYKQICLQSEHWDKYETHFGEAAEAMNDTYLKINSQQDGTKSYGRVADLVIADYYTNVRQSVFGE